MTPGISLGALACSRCGKANANTRTVCSHCLGDVFEAIVMEGVGRLVSWTTIRRAPTQFRDEAPYQVCVVDLECGQRVTGRLTLSDGVHLGDRVVATGIRGNAPVFQPLP